MYIKYMSSQALDEGFKIIHHRPGSEIFYRTDDWPRYKDFKGRSIDSEIINEERYQRHANEIAKLLNGDEKVLSLGGGLGVLERNILKIHEGCSFAVSDIYHRDASRVTNMSYPIIDMTKTESIQAILPKFDTVLIANALSPLNPKELQQLFHCIGKSGIKKIIIYSAEDIRPLGLLIYLMKEFLRFKPACWIGFLYSHSYISGLAKKQGFRASFYARPRQRGVLTPLWGSTYLAVFSRKNSFSAPGTRISTENLLM